MTDETHPDREVIEYEVVIVGAGPSGLSAAIRLKQIDPNLSVVVLEKGSEVGTHILSGAVLDPIGLNRLNPDWKERGAPIAEHRLDHPAWRRRAELPEYVMRRAGGNEHGDLPQQAGNA